MSQQYAQRTLCRYQTRWTVYKKLGETKLRGSYMITYIAADDFVVLGIFDDLMDTLNSLVHIRTWPTDENNILVRSIASLCSNLDRKGLFFTDDATETMSIPRSQQ